MLYICVYIYIYGSSSTIVVLQLNSVIEFSYDDNCRLNSIVDCNYGTVLQLHHSWTLAFISNKVVEVAEDHMKSIKSISWARAKLTGIVF